MKVIILDNEILGKIFNRKVITCEELHGRLKSENIFDERELKGATAEEGISIRINQIKKLPFKLRISDDSISLEDGNEKLTLDFKNANFAVKTAQGTMKIKKENDEYEVTLYNLDAPVTSVGSVLYGAVRAECMEMLESNYILITDLDSLISHIKGIQENNRINEQSR